jgi:hypothetical protein
MSIIAYPPEPSTTNTDNKPFIPEKTPDGRRNYVLNGHKSPTVEKKSLDSQLPTNPVPKPTTDDWLSLAQQTFSSPSQEKRGENVFVSSLNVDDDTDSPASQVPDACRTARSLQGGSSQSVQGVVSSLLDYRNTQAEKRKRAEQREKDYAKYFSKIKPDVDLYKYKTILSGDTLELYEYEDFQRSKKGKPKKQKEKDEESIEEKTEEQIKEIRKKSISRASKHIKRTINANVGKWGHELPKFLTLTFEDHITDFETANYEFKKFHQRLSYRIGYKLMYTVVVQFQDGERKGGIKGGRGGVIHYHVVLYNMPFIRADKLQKIWGKGFIKINAIDNVDNLGAYVVGGYMCKKLDDVRYDGQKRYFSSRGLYEPLEVKSALPIDLGEFTEDHKVYETPFENEYTGVIHYKQYNLKRTIRQKRRIMECRE